MRRKWQKWFVAGFGKWVMVGREKRNEGGMALKAMTEYGVYQRVNCGRGRKVCPDCKIGGGRNDGFFRSVHAI